MLRQLAGQLLGVCQHRIHASQAVLAAALTFLGSEAEQAEQSEALAMPSSCRTGQRAQTLPRLLLLEPDMA